VTLQQPEIYTVGIETKEGDGWMRSHSVMELHINADGSDFETVELATDEVQLARDFCAEYWECALDVYCREHDRHASNLSAIERRRIFIDALRNMRQ
jgi:hypothetical protein